MDILVLGSTTAWCAVLVAIAIGIATGLLMWATSGSKKINIKNSSTPPSLH